jgi:hypothetical protein
MGPVLILQQMLSERIHRTGSVDLRHLGETVKLSPFPSVGILLTYFANHFFLLLFELEIRNA